MLYDVVMRQYSRLNRHRERESRKQVLGYALLSIVFLVVVVKFGVPAFIQGVSWWTGQNDTEKQSTDLDIPPQAPVLAILPEATFSGQIKVEGLAQQDMKIRLTVNDVPTDETSSKEDGSFLFERVSLRDGENQLKLVSINSKNKESKETVAVVILDKKAPEIEILEPSNEVSLIGTNEQNLLIKGKVEDQDVNVRVNDNFVNVGIDGTFEYRTRLNEGVNELVVTAVDLASNTSEKVLRVTWSL